MTPEHAGPYKPCVLGADGRCTRWSHSHGDQPARPGQGAWIVTADGLRVGGPFDDHEDAEGFAAAWNSAYPSPEHTEFVVEQITAEEAIYLDRRNV